MEKTKNSQIVSYVGAGLMLLALLLPYISVSVFGQSMLSLGLIFDMGKLGDANGLMYLISILGLGLLGYCAYISFSVKADYVKASYGCLGYFVVILIMFFIVRNDIVNLSGLSRYESQFASNFLKMGFGLFMPLLAGGAYFLADKLSVNEKIAENKPKE